MQTYANNRVWGINMAEGSAAAAGQSEVSDNRRIPSAAEFLRVLAELEAEFKAGLDVPWSAPPAQGK
jgi:hypothetical protein